MAGSIEEEKIPGYKEDTCIVKGEDVKEETTEIQGI